MCHENVCVCVCFIGPDHILSNSIALYEFCQWMASGSHGLYGQAVLKPVEGGASRETGFVMGPFLEGSRVLENEKRSGAVMKRDVQVSGWEHRLHCHEYLIREGNLSYLEMFSIFTWYSYMICTLYLWAEPHEICGEDNFSNVVWKMTPAGDTAAVRCPPNAMGELGSQMSFFRKTLFYLHL